MRRVRSPALGLAVLAGSGGCAGGHDRAPSAPPAPLFGESPSEPAPLPEGDLLPPDGAEGTLQPITSRGQVPLHGYRVDAAPGDWMLAGSDAVAVISAKGNLIDFGPPGGHDELSAVQPTLQLALDVAVDDVARIEPTGANGNVLRVARAVRGQPLVLVV